MPIFGLRGATIAAYHNNNGVVTYDAPISAGCAIQANLELTFAEARLYACDMLSEYLREAIGGTITFGAKLFPDAAQQLMFGSTEKTSSVTVPAAGGTTETKTIKSLVTSGNDNADYVGFSCYCPDLINNVRKYTAFFVAKVKFSPPSKNLQTRTDSIAFVTPSTTGQFMPDDTANAVIIESATCDSEDEAKAWCQAVFPQAQQSAQTPASGGEGGGTP